LSSFLNRKAKKVHEYIPFSFIVYSVIEHVNDRKE